MANVEYDLDNLLGEVVEEVIEIEDGAIDEDLLDNNGGSFISTGGIFDVTIDKAFLEVTKNGFAFSLHTSGNSGKFMLFPFNKDKKTGKIVTTKEYKGKVSKNPDFKLFKQLYFVATKKLVKELSDIKTEKTDIKYTDYGKEVKKTVAMIPELVGKKIKIGVRRKAKYKYDKEAQENDKTQYATDKDGNLYYDLSLYSVYGEKGHTPKEGALKQEPSQWTKDDEWLSSDKSIFRPKLEEPEEVEQLVEELEEELDELDF